MTKITQIRHTINATVPRLSDEDRDIMERDDSKEGNYSSITMIEGWQPWDPEDIKDIRNIISKLDPKDQFILDAYLDGLTYNDIGVTERYWRWHFAKGLKVIKKELAV